MESKSELSKLYHKLTGITIPLEDIIENTPEESKPALFKKIVWQIRRGEILDNKGDYQNNFKNFIPQLAELLGIEGNVEDIDKDGDVDVEDEKIKKDLEKASTIEVEIDDSAEEIEDNGIEIEP